MVRVFKVASACGLDAAWTPAGSQACADLITTMARKLDRAVALQLADAPDDAPAPDPKDARLERGKDGM